MRVWLVVSCFIKPAMRKPGPYMPGFLNLLWFACWYVPLRVLITSGMIWCGIVCVWLVKQVLQLFPAFSCFIWHLPSINWMGVAILTQHVVNTCQRRWCGTSYGRTAEHFIFKGKVTNAKRCIKIRPANSFTVIILA